MGDGFPMFELNSKMNDERIEEIGENHVATSAENPIRPDAFDISDEEKIVKIEKSNQTEHRENKCIKELLDKNGILKKNV